MMIEIVIAICVISGSGKRNQYQERKQEDPYNFIGHEYNKQIGFYGASDIENPSYNL